MASLSAREIVEGCFERADFCAVPIICALAPSSSRASSVLEDIWTRRLGERSRLSASCGLLCQALFCCETMATLGTGGPKESTEWDDILRSKGIIPEKTVDELANDVLKTMVEEKVENFDPHANKSVTQLDEDLEDADSDEG